MNCKNCLSNEALMDNDSLYSSYLCLKCGYYYRENGQEIELKQPYCLLILNDTHYETITNRKKLLIVLRTFKKINQNFKIELRRFNNERFTTKILLL